MAVDSLNKSLLDDGAYAGAEVGALVDPVPAVPAAELLAELVDACLAADEHDWLVLVDGRQVPLTLVDRGALLRGDPYEWRFTTVTSRDSAFVAARRAVERPRRERLRPLVCCDESGRYAGLVRVDRLLAALAGRHHAPVVELAMQRLADPPG